MILLKILALGIILACFVELCRKCGHVLAADEMYGRWWLVLFAIVLIAPAADARPHLFNRRPTQAIDAPQADPPQRTHSLLPRRSAAGSNSSAKTLSQPAAPSRAPKAPAETQGCDCGCKDCTGRPGCPCKCKDCRCNAKQTKCDCATTGVCTCGESCRCENCPRNKHAAQRPGHAASDLSGTERGLLAGLNDLRRAHGKAPLVISDRLQRNARDRARTMYSAHQSSVPMIGAAEDVAGVYWSDGSVSDPATSMRGFRYSPGHMQPILAYNAVGVARHGRFDVVIFGRDDANR